MKIAEATATYTQALEAWHRFQAEHRPRPLLQPAAKLSFASLADEFLEFCSGHRSPKTYRWYQDFLRSFVADVGTGLLVADVAPRHVLAWVQAKYPKGSPNTRRGAIRAVQRVTSWGRRTGFLPSDPLHGMEKPRQTSRETVLTESQERNALAAVDPGFRDYIRLGLLLGARPQELRILSATHWHGDRFILPRVDSKGKRDNRVIYCPAEAVAIVRRLVSQHAEGPLLRGLRGQPLTTNAVRCRFRELRKKGILPRGVSAGCLRHTFATRAVLRGVDLATLSTLLGHRNIQTTADHYAHLAGQHGHLLDALERATNGGKTPGPDGGTPGANSPAVEPPQS